MRGRRPREPVTEAGAGRGEAGQLQTGHCPAGVGSLTPRRDLLCGLNETDELLQPPRRHRAAVQL